MILHTAISDQQLRSRIRQQIICFGGNKSLKIYGTLQCASGKRLKKANRVFFTSLQDALKNKFRPCGHCLKADYKKWNDGII